MGFFRRLFLKMNSVDKLVTAFTKQVSKLEKLAEQHNKHAEVNDKTIQKLQESNEKSKAEAARALSVADKIKTLIS